MSDTKKRWTSRKFWTMIAVSVAYTALLVSGHLGEQVYAWLQGLTVGAYLGANVMQHMKGPMG